MSIDEHQEQEDAFSALLSFDFSDHDHYINNTSMTLATATTIFDDGFESITTTSASEQLVINAATATSTGSKI